MITRNATGIRGVLHATLVAFDKQWNLALTDALEIWKRKGQKKRKIPPGLGELIDVTCLLKQSNLQDTCFPLTTYLVTPKAEFTISTGTPVPKGTAAKISPVPVVTETPLGGGIWECTRHLPQLMVRGEHVVLINIVER